MRKPAINLPDDYSDYEDSLTLVTSSSRLASELRYAFDYAKVQANEKVWKRPQIQSYTQWLFNSYRQLGSSDPQLALRSIVSQDTLMLLAQQQAPNVEVEMHARAIVDAWQLVWDANLWVDFQDIRSTENGRLCEEWFQRIRRCLDREQLITAAEIPAVLQRAIERHDWRPEGILTFGFRDLNVAQRNLFVSLHAHDRCSAIKETCVAREDATHRLQGFEKANEEFSTLALWTREKLAQYGSNATIGVVINGLGSSFSAVKRSFESVFPEITDISRLVSIDSGQPVTQHRAYLDFIHLLKWTCGPLDYKALLQLAKSPYFQRLNLHRKPQSWFREHMTIKQYRNRMRRSERSVLDQVIKIAPSNSTQPLAFADIAKAMLDLTQTSGYSKQPEDRFAYVDTQAVQVLNDLILRLAQAAAIRPRTSWARFIDLIEILAADQTIHVSRSDAPIQVMGREASTLLRFDALWVTGVSDVDWPAVPRPNPFVPRHMQKQANLPRVSHEQMLEEARVLTNHWRTCANEIVFSYVSQIDKVEAQPSSLFSDLGGERDDGSDATSRKLVNQSELIQHGHPWSTYSVSDVIREYQQPNGSKIAVDDVKAATRLLRNQAQCPFKGWAVHRARLEESEGPIPRFPNPAQRGSIFHYVVAEILSVAKTQEQLQKLGEKTLFKAIDKVLADSDETKTLPKRFLKHERTRLLRWIKEWLAIQLDDRLDFEVLDVEKQVEVEIEGLTFRGYIDRIDRTATMERVIIDHKTGASYTPKRWDPDRLNDPQMPMYATAEAACDGIAYLSIYRTSNGLATRWEGVGQSTNPDIVGELEEDLGNYASLTELKHAWRARLSQIVKDHLDGKADVDPVDSDVCTYCHLSNLCRIYEDENLSYTGGEDR